MSRRDRLGNERIIKALEASFGILTDAAKKLRVHRKTLAEWIKDDPELAEARDYARDMLLDLGETKLMQNVRAGKERSVQYLLDTQGRQRGYGQRLIITDPKGEKDLENKTDAELLAELANLQKRIKDAAK